MRQEAYLWQRSWGPSVGAALAGAADRLDAVTVLAAEIEWRQGRPRVVRVPIDYDALCGIELPIGLALRIGPFAGPFDESDATASQLASLAAELLRTAADAGLTVRELQVDFDCAQSKLDGYRRWITAIRRGTASHSLVITALPSWLREPAFRRLAGSTDGYILQVHSLERPSGVDAPMTLCDPIAARAAVDTAATVGVPFRVALPTYGYVVAFDREGRFLGLQAEGPSASWPEDVQLRVLRADPRGMARLVDAWTRSRPGAFEGVIWYRLPTDDDQLNWCWPTLAAVMAGREPNRRLYVDTRRVEPSLYEFDLVNDGEADCAPPASVTINWRDGRVVAGDGLSIYRLDEMPPNRLRFHRLVDGSKQWLSPGRRMPVGWLRLDRDTEVRIDVLPEGP